jgi:N-acylneuraminate cytidylyltransferase
MTISAFIFARGGSKGLINKNLKDFHGKPLIGWAIECALSLKCIDSVIVSTDSLDIANVSKSFGALVPFMRPKKLAKDDSPEWMAWRHALEFVSKEFGSLPEAMLSLPTTAPLRSSIDVQNCLDLYEKEKPDAVITVTESHRSPFFNMVKKNEDGSACLVCDREDQITRRQDTPNVYDMTTVAYVVNSQFVMQRDSLFAGKVMCVDVPIERAIDIDTQLDFDIAKFLYTRIQ